MPNLKSFIKDGVVYTYDSEGKNSKSLKTKLLALDGKLVYSTKSGVVEPVFDFEPTTPDEPKDPEITSVNKPSISIDTNGKVSITCSTSQTTIYYTADGKTPTKDSNKYSTSFSVVDGTTVKAIGYVKTSTSEITSDVAQSTYNAPTVNKPSISITEEGQVTITCSTNGAKIYYTTDSSNPSNSDNLYSKAFNLQESCTVKAIAYATFGISTKTSDIAEKAYTKIEPEPEPSEELE